MHTCPGLVTHFKCKYLEITSKLQPNAGAQYYPFLYYFGNKGPCSCQETHFSYKTKAAHCTNKIIVWGATAIVGLQRRCTCSTGTASGLSSKSVLDTESSGRTAPLPADSVWSGTFSHSIWVITWEPVAYSEAHPGIWTQVSGTEDTGQISTDCRQHT